MNQKRYIYYKKLKKSKKDSGIKIIRGITIKNMKKNVDEISSNKL